MDSARRDESRVTSIEALCVCVNWIARTLVVTTAAQTASLLHHWVAKQVDVSAILVENVYFENLYFTIGTV